MTSRGPDGRLQLHRAMCAELVEWDVDTMLFQKQNAFLTAFLVLSRFSFWREKTSIHRFRSLDC